MAFSGHPEGAAETRPLLRNAFLWTTKILEPEDSEVEVGDASNILVSDALTCLPWVFLLAQGAAGGGPEARPEARGQRPEARGQRPETRDQRPEARDQRPEARGPEARDQRPEGETQHSVRGLNGGRWPAVVAQERMFGGPGGVRDPVGTPFFPRT